MYFDWFPTTYFSFHNCFISLFLLLFYFVASLGLSPFPPFHFLLTPLIPNYIILSHCKPRPRKMVDFCGMGFILIYLLGMWLLFCVLGYWRISHSMFHLLLEVPELLTPPAFFTKCIQSFQIYSRPVELDIFSQNEFQLLNLPLWNPIFYCSNLLVFFFFSISPDMGHLYMYTHTHTYPPAPAPLKICSASGGVSLYMHFLILSKSLLFTFLSCFKANENLLAYRKWDLSFPENGCLKSGESWWTWLWVHNWRDWLS